MQGVKNSQKDTQGMEYKRCCKNILELVLRTCS